MYMQTRQGSLAEPSSILKSAHETNSKAASNQCSSCDVIQFFGGDSLRGNTTKILLATVKKKNRREWQKSDQYWSQSCLDTPVLRVCHRRKKTVVVSHSVWVLSLLI